jgi:hypothetical protein
MRVGAVIIYSTDRHILGVGIVGIGGGPACWVTRRSAWTAVGWAVHGRDC